MEYQKKWFTLIELIIVIAIVAILITISFISYSSNLKDVRNTNREALVSSVFSWLESYKTNNWVYIKPSWISINFWSEKLGFQWYFDNSLSSEIGLWDVKDVLFQNFMVYRTTTFLDKFQILYSLETDNSFNEKNFYWDEIWVFMQWDSMPWADLDLSLDTTWVTLYINKTTSIAWWNDYNFVWSCLDLKRYWLSKSGVYSFKTALSSATNYYCNMDSFWWWWTAISAQYDFDPTSSWSEWIQGDYDPSLATRKSFSLNDSQVPSHSEFWFSNSLDKISDYVTFSYSPWSEIILENTLSPASWKSYDITRRTWSYYENLEPESWISLSWDFNNSLVIDENIWFYNQKSENTFAFSPNSSNLSDRSSAFWWQNLLSERQNFPFILWIR